MAFDDKLAARIKRHLGKKKGLVEKKMFGVAKYAAVLPPK